jgi:hypothetical protein
VKLVRRYDVDVAPEPEPAAEGPVVPVPDPGSQNRPVPRPPWMKGVLDGGNQNQHGPDAGPEPGTSQAPGTGTSGSGKSVPTPVLVLVSRAVLAAARAVGAVLLRLAETPGHPLNRLWAFEPKSLAAHHAHAKTHGRDKELQLHAIGKVLVLTGAGLIALGWSAKGQRITLAVLALMGAAIGFLVF